MITILLAFFIIFQVNFTEEKKKELIEEFKKSVNRSNMTFGLGGILPDWNTKSTEDIQKLKYIYPEAKSEPTESGDKGIDLLDREEDQIPAAVVVYFDENDSTLFMEGKHSLDSLIDLIGERPCSLVIEGHTRKNFVPSKGYDNCWKLSLDRAQAVADYLHEKGNISWKRLVTVGYGNNKPMVKDIKSDQYNDRVSVIINILK
ncbi:MAG: OmpA family protein [Planctomycetes bacterium]|nr:OmpA family protein [Planctomycetota bacterium]